jgi:hypothetical protein
MNQAISKKCSLLALASIVALLPGVSETQAAILNMPGLTHVIVWEATGPISFHLFPQNGTKMTNQLGVGVLGPNNNDFSPLPSENYDVFYSDANGNFNLNGNYVTVEAVYSNASGGGGLNVAAVDLFFLSSSTSLRADVLASFQGLGPNYTAGSEIFAADPDAGPSTFTSMGSTMVPPTQHLRVTVTWKQLVPEPATFGLLSLSFVLVALKRHGR